MSEAKTCFIIPFYNHGQQLPKTVKALLKFDLPIIIVNDGSDEASTNVLNRLAAENDKKIFVKHLSENGGKGVATWTGLSLAAEKLFSHALQLDADGQHNFADIDKFLALSRQLPNHYIIGQATYDETVPKARLYGRYITHFWVWIETLSFKIKDSMCGFRIYRVNDFMKCFPEKAPSPRMDFDIEVLVRLSWLGRELTSLKTAVIYPPDGLSHFEPFRSNLRISWMHTRLFFGMLWRFPRLVLRKIL